MVGEGGEERKISSTCFVVLVEVIVEHFPFRGLPIELGVGVGS